MKTYTKEELAEVFEKHRRWLANEDGGARADLSDADLFKANLRDAKNLVFPLACPEKGSFIGWKKCRGDLIVELEICADAKRSSATGESAAVIRQKLCLSPHPTGRRQTVQPVSFALILSIASERRSALTILTITVGTSARPGSTFSFPGKRRWTTDDPT